MVTRTVVVSSLLTEFLTEGRKYPNRMYFFYWKPGRFFCSSYFPKHSEVIFDWKI